MPGPRRGDRFEGITAIITGGASGIGRALGTELLRRGASVVLADVDGAAASGAAAAMDGPVVASELDVRDASAFERLVGAVRDREGSVDLLVNNAGISLGGRTDELSAAHWDRIIDVNVKGVVNGVRAVYPAMIEQGHGHIVNVASAAGLVAPPFVAAYAMSKHAVIGLSTALRAEAALHGVRVSVLCPGAVDTAILDRPPPADLPATVTPPVTPRAYLAVVGQKPVDADGFARLVIDAVARNRRIIVVPRAARGLWYLDRLSPRLTDVATRAAARRVEKKLLR